MAELAWLQPLDLPDWPTEEVVSPAVACALAVPRSWGTDPVEELGSTLTQHRFCGPGAADRLVVEMLDGADPMTELRRWVDSTLAMTGLPAPALLNGGDAAPVLLEWGEDVADEAEATRLSVDRLHLFRGLAELAGPPAELARLYVVLARRGTRAWKVALGIMSACPPGTPEEIVVANDHVRAAAILGRLRLDPGFIQTA